MLLKLKNELAPGNPGVKPLCPTCWTMRAEFLRSVLTNYTVIMSVLEEIMEEYKGNFEASCQARGVLTTMENFHFLFGVAVSKKVFTITDKLHE